MNSKQLVRLLAVGAALLALGVGAGFFFGNGCSTPRPVVVHPDVPTPPKPEPVEAHKQLLIVHENRADDFEMAQLVIALRKPENLKRFNEHGCRVTLLDVGQQTWDEKPSQILEKFKADIDKVKTPAVFILNQAGDKVLHSDSLINPATKKLLTVTDLMTALDVHAGGEENFAAMPFVDCDFSQCAEFVKGDITEGDTFNVPPPPDAEPTFEDAIELIARERWDACIAEIDAAGGGLDLLIDRIYNQKNEGACVSNATCQGTQVVEKRQWGYSIDKSAISLYKRCGRSPNSGSMVSTNLKELLSGGVLPLDTEANKARFPHTMPNTGFYTKYPEGWERTAVHFRGLEYYDIRSMDGFVTALLKGYPVVYGRAGHSICAVRPVKRNGRLYVKYANSWGDWGDHGFGYDSEAMIRQGATWAFALRSVRDHGFGEPTLAKESLKESMTRKLSEHFIRAQTAKEADPHDAPYDRASVDISTEDAEPVYTLAN